MDAALTLAEIDRVYVLWGVESIHGLTVNGRPLHEPYLPAGEPASAQAFDVVVPAGRLWMMGDHRSDSADSRAHLGDPGGGTVPLDRVIGKVLVRFWPLTRLGGSDEMAAATR